AALELEWWIVHREVEDHPPGDLEHALAELAAELYQVPAERLRAHAAPAARSGCGTTPGTGSRPSSGSPGRPWPTRSARSARPSRPDQPARGHGGHAAPGQVAGHEQQPGNERGQGGPRGGGG